MAERALDKRKTKVRFLLGGPNFTYTACIEDPSSVRIAPSKNGLGVFAACHFAPGTEILQFAGKMVRACELPVPYVDDKFVQIGPDLYLGPSGLADDYVNHSCDPNCRLKIAANSVILMAIKDVAQGDELTFDYASTMQNDDWTLECNCGARACRGVVRERRQP